jgi:acetyl esterase/lipase
VITRRSVLGASAVLTGCARTQGILEATPPKADARIPYGADPNQFGDLFLPVASAGPHPLVIFIHGGYWRKAYDLTHAGFACQALTREGFAVWSLEYRRLGQPGGGWPGTFDDVKQAAAHVDAIASKYAFNRKRVVTGGHSAGGQLALWLAKQNVIDLLGVVALAAVSDLKLAWELKLSNGVVGDLLGGSPDDVPARYTAVSPLEFLPIGPPQRMVHGDGDDVVPYDMSETFVKASKNAILRPVRGAGHFDLIDPRSAAWPFVRDSFRQTLSSAA